MSVLDISFTPESLSEIARFAGIPMLISQEVQQAMERGSDILIQSAQGNMHWKNPTGALESSIRRMSESPYEIIVGSDLPYAARREYGFHGADSLGRVYNDEGAFFLTQAMNDNEQQILILIDQAVEKAMGGH